jgi:hypothetical protein
MLDGMQVAQLQPSDLPAGLSIASTHDLTGDKGFDILSKLSAGSLHLINHIRNGQSVFCHNGRIDGTVCTQLVATNKSL